MVLTRVIDCTRSTSLLSKPINLVLTNHKSKQSAYITLDVGMNYQHVKVKVTSCSQSVTR